MDRRRFHYVDFRLQSVRVNALIAHGAIARSLEQVVPMLAAQALHGSVPVVGALLVAAMVAIIKRVTVSTSFCIGFVVRGPEAQP